MLYFQSPYYNLLQSIGMTLVRMRKGTELLAEKN